MTDESYEGIAIIGMAGRFPGAESVEELWANLIAGKESISFFSDEELAESGLDGPALRSRGHYVPARGVLKDADCFDAAFFGVHPKEAEVMDPQQRLFLEICWTALERAGYPPNQMPVSVGVFGGATFNTYYLHALHNRAGSDRARRARAGHVRQREGLSHDARRLQARSQRARRQRQHGVLDLAGRRGPGLPVAADVSVRRGARGRHVRDGAAAAWLLPRRGQYRIGGRPHPHVRCTVVGHRVQQRCCRGRAQAAR